jgi:hypothetical protein
MSLSERIARLCNSCSQMSSLNTGKNRAGAGTIFAIAKVSFSGCISRSIHFLISSVEDFVPPADSVEFWEDEALFPFHVVIDVCIVFWVDEFSSSCTVSNRSSHVEIT